MYNLVVNNKEYFVRDYVKGLQNEIIMEWIQL